MKFDIAPDAMEFIKKESEGKKVRFFIRRKAWMGNIFDWVQDEPQDGDEVFEEDGLTIVMSERDMVRSVLIKVRLQEYPWGEDLAISSIF